MLLGIGAAIVLAGAAAWFFFLRPPADAATAQVAPPAPVTTAPAVSERAPAVPVDAPMAAATPPAVEPSSAPTATPPAPAVEPPAAATADARALLQAGSYPEAARRFADDLKSAGRNAATVQLLIACSAETVQKAVENVGAMELVIVPHQFQGRDCYRLCWGIYPSTKDATAAVRMLPPYFRERGASPKVMRAAEITP
jgi:septal ring-binding cell division protein DamX